MISAAMLRLRALLEEAWSPVADNAILLHPDDKTDFEAALTAAEADSKVVVRYYHPQLLQIGSIGRFLVNLDVCSRTSEAAATRADELLHALKASSARDPTGAIQPAAVPIRETSYTRVAGTFTLLSDTIPS
jgi:hypothetical protein